MHSGQQSLYRATQMYQLDIRSTSVHRNKHTATKTNASVIISPDRLSRFCTC